MIITNIRYGRFAFMSIALCLIVFMYLVSQFGMRSSGEGFFNRVGKHFHHWFQETVFQLNWEEINCIKRQDNETTFDESWVPPLAEQLNLRDGHSIFDSNTRCNDWLLALKKKYPALKIGGADSDPEAVEFAKRLFNNTPSTFGRVTKGKLEFVSAFSYDHAFNFGGLREMTTEYQCNLVRELLRIVKPGGSIYLGHNMEKNECPFVEKYRSGYGITPECYWTEVCLVNRTDIAEVYYIKEKDLFGVHPSMEECFTAVFIHKNVIFNKVPGGPENPKPKYVPHAKMYRCKDGSQKDPVLPDHDVGMLFNHKNLAQGLKLHQIISSQQKNNSSA